MTCAKYGVSCLFCKEKLLIPFDNPEYQKKAEEFFKQHRDCETEEKNKEEYNKNKPCNCTCQCKYICAWPDEEAEKLYEFMNQK